MIFLLFSLAFATVTHNQPSDDYVSQVHLSVSGPQSNGIRVAYRINSSDGVWEGDVVVEYSTDGGKTWKSSPVNTSCQYWHDGLYASVVFDSLEHKKEYPYRIIDATTKLVYRQGIFLGPPSVKDEVTFSVYGDLGYGKVGKAVESHTNLLSLYKGVDAFIHVGDIAYVDDAFLRTWSSSVRFAYETVYNLWMDWMEPMMMAKPYMVAPGNHEVECHSPRCIISSEKRTKFANFSAYNCRWPMPSNDSGGRASMWYSWDYGPIHFISLNTETDWDGASEQSRVGMHMFPAGHFGRDGEYLSWLEKDLKKAQANRAERPWIIAYGHRPLYRDGIAACCEPKLCESHEPLLKKYKVDLYMHGHAHLYLRSTPLDGSRPVHVGPGGPGCDERYSKDYVKRNGTNERFNYLINGISLSTAVLRVTRDKLTWSVLDSVTNGTIDFMEMNSQTVDHEEVIIA
eukprot:GEMP01017930.1.p1 GENE.GEMP01017930.1~~GEMP01017930.1.p1  ORF type:complete len:456 (-),score=62.71 GEMP01017930.1:1407-2774(-)